MPRYVALLRGVSPLNAKMPELKRAFEKGGFTEVKTVLGSGNVVFDAPEATDEALAAQAEAAMKKHLKHPFTATVRSQSFLLKLIAAEPFAHYEAASGKKHVVTFLRAPSRAPLKLPVELDGAIILGKKGREVFSAYVVSPKGPVFMKLIERTFGKDVTTRTWDTVLKLSKA